jgi:hypothetical protein
MPLSQERKRNVQYCVLGVVVIALLWCLWVFILAPEGDDSNSMPVPTEALP